MDELNKMIENDNTLNEDDKKYLLYEFAFLNQEDHVDFDILMDNYKNKKYFLNHCYFDAMKEKQKMIDDYLENPFELNDSIEQCQRCKSYKTVSYNMITRSCDEGVSVVVTCIVCKARFVINS